MKFPGLSSPGSRTHRLFRPSWPRVSRTATAWLMGVELIGLVPVLVIFGIAQPDMYRSAMWEIGFQNKLNSNPKMTLYAYANYQPLPKVPLVWSQTLTDFNVAISVVSLFFLLAKLIAHIMRVWYPAVAILVNCALVALYSVSTYGQIGPDYADSRYPAPAAWYFRQGCGLARQYGKYRSCQVAQASLFVTLYSLSVYLLNLSLAAYALCAKNVEDEACDDDGDSTTFEYKDRPYEMHSMKSPATVRDSPFTPRTQAFHILDRQLPLRQQGS